MNGALRLPPTDLSPEALGHARPLMLQLDRIVQRIVDLHAEFSDAHIIRLRAELTMTERALEDCRRELESQAFRLAARLAAVGSGHNVLDWNPSRPPTADVFHGVAP
jgi:hypothetical protein